MGISKAIRLFSKAYKNINYLTKSVCSSTLDLKQECTDYTKLTPPWRVLFFGTDEFSVESLQMLCRELKEGNLVSHLEVVTSTKYKASPVRQFANKEQLIVRDWPLKLSKGEFDIGLVVSFGHLIPQHIITAFSLGMLNVHASLLPRWRGAAPIIHAIRNGDTETGVTVMQIQPHKFDIGGIVRQSRYVISTHDVMPDVSAGLSRLGAQELLECVRELPQCLNHVRSQPETGITCAPRVTASLAEVSWEVMDAQSVYNLYRALKGLFLLRTRWHGLAIKLHNASPTEQPERLKEAHPGHVVYNRQSKLLTVKCCDGNWVAFGAVGVPGKKLMSPVDFHNGYLSKKSERDRYFT